MADNSAILFDFNDVQSAALACETLQQLGFDTVLHDGSRRMHVHIEGSDLTSALEIAQAHGGQLVEQAPITSGSAMDSAYALNAISIPAHLVNEDWPSSYGWSMEQPEGLHNRDEDADFSDEFLPDPGTYDHFSGDVRA
ncbi:MAG: hypothetical protein ACQEXQ_20255 [Bacillota bacterium]